MEVDFDKEYRSYLFGTSFWNLEDLMEFRPLSLDEFKQFYIEDNHKQ